MTSTREERPRRNPLLGAYIGGGFGLFFLAIGFNRPSIANMRTVDLVHLLATGACLGVALVATILYFVGRHKG
jgi:hypothetical protein